MRERERRGTEREDGGREGLRKRKAFSLMDTHKHSENTKSHPQTHHTTNRYSLTKAHKYIHSLKTRVLK